MASNANDLMANIKVTIGGVEVSRKHLDSLRTAAEASKDKLAELNKEFKAAAGDNQAQGKIQNKINEMETSIKNLNGLIKFEENELMNYQNVLDNLSGSTLQQLQRAARTLQLQMKEMNSANDPNTVKELSLAYEQVMNTIVKLNGKVPNLEYVMRNLAEVSGKSLKESEQYLKDFVASADLAYTKLTAQAKADNNTGLLKLLDSKKTELTQAKKSLEAIQLQMQRRTVTEVSPVLSNTNKTVRSKDELETAIKQAKELASQLKAGTQNFKDLGDVKIRSLDDLQKLNKLIEQGEQKLAKIDLDNMNSQFKNLGNMSESALSEQHKYWEKLASETSLNSKNLQEYKDKLKLVIEEENRREERAAKESRDKAQATMSNIGSATLTELDSAIKLTKQLRDATKEGTAEWTNYNKEIQSAEERVAELKRKMREALVTDRQADLTSLTSTQLSDQRKYWEEMVANTNNGSKALQDYKNKLKEVIEEENRRTKASATNVINNLGTSSKTEIDDAIKTLERLRGTTTYMGAEWENFNNQIIKARNYIQELDSMAKQLDMEDKFKNLTVLSKAALDEQKSYWTNMRDNAQAGSADLTNYENKLKEIAKLEADRKNAEIKTGAQNAMTTANSVGSSPLAISANEAREALSYLTQYQDTLVRGTKEYNDVSVAIEKYNEVLGKSKATLVDVSAVLADPKNFSMSQIQEAVKQLEDSLATLKTKDLDSGAAKGILENIQQLKAELQNGQVNTAVFDNIIARAKNGDASVKEMEDAIKSMQNAMNMLPKNASDKIKDYRDNIDTLTNALTQTKAQMSNVTELMDKLANRGKIPVSKILGEESLTSLRGMADALKQQISLVKMGSDEYTTLSKRLQEIKKYMKEMEAATSSASTAMDNAYSRLKNWVLVYASFDALKTRLGQAVSENLKFSDSLSDVRKVTGLTTDEVAKLSGEIQNLNTRISDEKLMQTAVEGGRLGLKSMKDILDFTKASAVTLTALDELDAKSVSSIVKLNTLLGETQKLGINRAILSTASAINELSINSAASQGPIIDFTRRFGGIAAQANISTAEITALGATLDALAQPVEMSSTAVNKFTTAILSNQESIAADTGLTMEYMRRMTQEGKTLELMMEVLSRMNGAGGLAEISKYIGDMGGKGARMTQVIAALASNVGFLREQVEVANRAFEEGTSVTNEYNLKNANAAALVERMNNEIKAAFVNSSATGAIQKMAEVAEFLVRQFTSTSKIMWVVNLVLKVLILAFISGSVVTEKITMDLKRMTASLVGFTKGIWSAVTSLEGFKTAMRGIMSTNPLGLFITLASVALSAAEAFGKTSDASDKLSSATEIGNRLFEEENIKLKDLKRQLDAAKEAKEGYVSIVTKINQTYQTYLNYLLSEAASYREIASAINLVTEAMHKKSLEEGKNEILKQIYEETGEEVGKEESSFKNDLRKELGGNKKLGFTDTQSSTLFAKLKTDFGLNLESAEKNAYESLTESTKAYIDDLIDVKVRADNPSLKKGSKVYDLRFEQKKDDAIKWINENATGYIKALHKQSNRINEASQEIDLEINEANRALIEQEQNHIKVLIEESGDLLNKKPSEYTQTDLRKLDEIKKSQENLLRMITEQTKALTPLDLKQLKESLEKDKNEYNNLLNKDSGKGALLRQIIQKKEAEINKLSGPLTELNNLYDQTKTEIGNLKNKEREYLLTFADNPFRDYDLKPDENGVLQKMVDENGEFLYKNFENQTEMSIQGLRNVYQKIDEVFAQLEGDDYGFEDVEARNKGIKLGNTKRSIEKYFKSIGLKIDSKYKVGLDTSKSAGSSGSSSSSSDNENPGKMSYQALLNNIRQFYEERRLIIQDAYKDDLITTERYNKLIEQNEEMHLKTRADMMEELTTGNDVFDEELYIRDLNNWNAAKEWVNDDKNHMKDTVSKDIASTRRRESDREIKKKQTQQKLLEDRNPFTKIVQGAADELDSIDVMPKLMNMFVNEGDSAKEFQVLIENASKVSQKVMRIIIQAAEGSKEEFGKTFREMVGGSEELTQLLGGSIQDVNKQFSTVTEDEWDAVYEVAVRAMNAIDEKQKSEITKNKELIKSMYENSEKYREGENLKNSLSTWKKTIDSDLDAERISPHKAYLANLKYYQLSYDMEAAMYRLRLEVAQKFFDAKEEMAEGAQEKEQVRLQREAYFNEMRKEWQKEQLDVVENVTKANNDEMNRMVEKYKDMAEKMGEMAGTMATAWCNSISDRKKALNSLLTSIKDFITQEMELHLKRLLMKQSFAKKEKESEEDAQSQTLQFVKETASDTIKTEANKSKQVIATSQNTANQKLDIETGVMENKVGINDALLSSEEQLSSQLTQISQEATVSRLEDSANEASAEVAMNGIVGQSEAFAQGGVAGFATSLAIAAAVAALSAALSSIINKFVPTSSSSSSSSSKKKLATGMLTYAEGRYTVDGNDGNTYSAQYEPTLQTGIYDGGNGKAHMALFSEVMPEMVISGPTTKNIQQNYPELMDAIMTVEKHGRLRRAVPTYAEGNVSTFSSPLASGTSADGEGNSDAAEQQAQFFASMQRMSAASEALLERLSQPITAELSMYGKNGAKEKLKKADKFYTKNKL